MGSKSSKNVWSFGISKIQELAGFGDGGTEIGFDQLYRGVKLKSLHPGTTKTNQNPEKSKKNDKKSGFWGVGGGTGDTPIFPPLRKRGKGKSRSYTSGAP